MENKKMHYIIIPVLIILLVIYSYQRVTRNQEIICKSDKVVSDSLIEIGNCFSYEEDGIYYGVILIKYEDDDLFTVALLDKTEKRELKNNDFIYGSLLCTNNNMIAPGTYGLSTGFFTKSDLKVFQQKFKYVCKIDLDDSKIEINGGGTLIIHQNVSIKDLRSSNKPLEIKQYTEPMTKYTPR
jgi:hypothetical protein